MGGRERNVVTGAVPVEAVHPRHVEMSMHRLVHRRAIGRREHEARVVQADPSWWGRLSTLKILWTIIGRS